MPFTVPDIFFTRIATCLIKWFESRKHDSRDTFGTHDFLINPQRVFIQKIGFHSHYIILIFK